MSCAKRKVTCMLVTPCGETFIGTNDCLRPQAVCPRDGFEGYDKCSTICRQPGHAEEMALINAGSKAKGARAFIHGITYVCRTCQEQLFNAGVESISVVKELPIIE